MKDTLLVIDGMYIIYHSIFRTIRIWEYKNKEEAKQYLKPAIENQVTNLLDSKTFKASLDISLIHTIQRITDIVGNALPNYFGLEPSSFATQLFVLDDKTNNGFRRQIFPEYKLYRTITQKKMYNFDLNAIRHYILSYLLDELDIWNRLGYTKVFVDNAEADDIIYVAMTEYYDQFSNKILIASDQDLLQIPDIMQYDLNSKLILRKNSKDEIMSCKEFLLRKIIMGDNSDNIPAILPRYGKVKAEKLLNNREEFKKLLNENSEALERFKINTKLIDISKMPDELKNKIKFVLKDIFENQLEHYSIDDLFNDSLNSPI